MSASLFILREMDCYWSDKNAPEDVESEYFPIVAKLYGAESLWITGHYFSQFYGYRRLFIHRIRRVNPILI